MPYQPGASSPNQQIPWQQYGQQNPGGYPQEIPPGYLQGQGLPSGMAEQGGALPAGLTPEMLQALQSGSMPGGLPQGMSPDMLKQLQGGGVPNMQQAVLPPQAIEEMKNSFMGGAGMAGKLPPDVVAEIRAKMNEEGRDVPPEMKTAVEERLSSGVVQGLPAFDTLLGESSTPTNATQVYGMAGLPMMLNCSVSPSSAMSAMWLSPDNSPVSSGREVIDSLKDRVLIMGDPRVGQYNLFFRRLDFAKDRGTWTCLSFGGRKQQLSLTIISPPAVKIPTITPSNVTVVREDQEAMTFTCVAQFSFPPVQLEWVRLSGPETEYKTTLPNFYPSPEGTLSTNVKVILTPQNSGSVFSCRAKYPTFGGTVYTKEVLFGSTPRAAAGEKSTNIVLVLILKKRKKKLPLFISVIQYNVLNCRLNS